MTGTALQDHTAERNRADPRTAAPVRSRSYAAAQRHSSRVRVLRRVIPVASVLAGALIIGGAVFNPFGQGSAVSIRAIGVSGTQVTMQNPRMTGHRGDNRPYEVTAVTAVQDVRKPNVIELREMRARLALDDAGKQARLESDTGVFDSGRERLELRQNVRVTTDHGQEALLRSASIDFKAGTVTSREPVRVSFVGGVVEADNLDVTENGKIIVFTGRVRSVFDAAQSGPGADAAPTRTSQAEMGRRP